LTAAQVVADLEARGVTVTERGGFIVLRPPEAVTSADVAILKASKAEVISVLRGRAIGTDWTTVNLWQLDKVLEVAVPWSDVRLLIAPGCRIARQLRATDPKPGRVWCSCEILDLLLSGVTPEDARKIAATRLDFDATLRGVFPAEKAREAKA
jgi:hypothetical protein